MSYLDVYGVVNIEEHTDQRWYERLWVEHVSCVGVQGKIDNHVDQVEGDYLLDQFIDYQAFSQGSLFRW